MLSKLSEFGTESGMYRYAERQHGATALQAKLMERFDYIQM